MKQTIVILCLVITMASCNNANTSKTGTDSTTTTEKAATPAMELPFKLEQPYKNWQIGSTENAVAAMKALKAFVDKDFAALTALTGDTLEVTMDYFHAKMSRDSAIQFFTKGRPMYNDLAVSINDYESVISEDKKDEWVTIWYKQTWKDAKGIVDSVSVINDIKMQDGKMVTLNEMMNHYPKK